MDFINFINHILLILLYLHICILYPGRVSVHVVWLQFDQYSDFELQQMKGLDTVGPPRKEKLFFDICFSVCAVSEPTWRAWNMSDMHLQ